MIHEKRLCIELLKPKCIQWKTFISTTFDNLLFKFNIHSYTYYILHKCTYIIKLATKSLFKKIII